MLYLDNAATTPVLPEVIEEMKKVLENQYGNPSSKYYELAVTAKEIVETAKKDLAQLVGSNTEEIVFTSGATESNNMILKGVAEAFSSKGNHIITSKAEHNSIIDICSFLESKGFEVTYLDVDSEGRVDIETLKSAITERTILISLMWVNNELGTINDIPKLSEVAKEHGAFFHTDATQALGKIKINWKDTESIDFLSASAHKIFGPKGVGLALLRQDEYGVIPKITPLIHGGGQENSLRSGTYSLHNIAGFAKAANLAHIRFEENNEQLQKLEDLLVDSLSNRFSNKIRFNSPENNKVPGVVNVRFLGVNNEILLKKLAPIIAASTGSACSSAKPSHVLQAIGLTLSEVRESVRFSISPYQTEQEFSIFNEL